MDYFDGTRKLGYPKDDQFFVVKGKKLFVRVFLTNFWISTNIFCYFLELLPKPGAKPPTPVETTSSTTTPLPDVINKNPFLCRVSKTTVKGRQSCRGELIFESDFKNYLNNRDKLWTVQRKFASGPVSFRTIF